MINETRIYLNTWKNYNEGGIGYGWMTATEARDFIESDPERDGGEWFIADIDNYLGIKIASYDYCNVIEVIETIEALEEMGEDERKEIVALMEYMGTENAQKAIDEKDNYTFYSDIDEYHNSMDELIEEELKGAPEIVGRYFDYEAYHRDCDFDIHEMSNGVCISE